MISNKKCFWELLIYIFCFVFIVSVMNAQIVNKHNNCEENESLISVYTARRENGSKLIFIARRGIKERGDEYSLNRLKHFKQMMLLRAKSTDMVFAIGEKSKSRPQVEVYINGKLELVFEAPIKQLIKVGNCQN